MKFWNISESTTYMISNNSETNYGLRAEKALEYIYDFLAELDVTTNDSI